MLVGHFCYDCSYTLANNYMQSSINSEDRFKTRTGSSKECRGCDWTVDQLLELWSWACFVIDFWYFSCYVAYQQGRKSSPETNIIRSIQIATNAHPNKNYALVVSTQRSQNQKIIRILTMYNYIVDYNV